ncbi:uncharacterized protein BT62DRAFT_926762 [Guyanagaster necrorhizus]|uniref:Zn(2)-C6 fungal-type domain-containing protein n=1 Tax=Guyanagaster necrorhizus TaxID=856835 RepID=A0A9P7W2R6_9AGAR|nr:uncharacterized protein BT62DRAFT_926762 [Guyanagaster necrorhizus MCA 3950]KAG7451107.1 hypothetical protein BT62DRAFT_926762 [Guyanagaster necrorhizus MCA 3950]
MSDSYNSGQPWNYPRYGHVQLEHEYALSASDASQKSYDAIQPQQNRNLSSSYAPNTSFSQSYVSGPQSERMSSYSNDGQHSRTDAGLYVPDAMYGSSQQSRFANAFPSNSSLGPDSNFTMFNGAYTLPPAGSISPNPSSVTSGRIAAPPVLSTSPAPMQRTFSAEPAPQLYFQHPSIPASSTSALSQQPKAKRQRLPDGGAEEDDEVTGENKDDIKAKPRACARCKNLKVRCEFKTDTDPCKRCLNGGHECVIPGKKKRRVPPKREHLMNEIREQAEHIQRLMAQLDESNKKLKATPVSSRSDTISSHSPSPSLHSPVLSPSSTHASSYFTSDAPPDSNLNVDTEANKKIEAWIAQARSSFAEFEGFIGIGLPKSFVVDHDPEEDVNRDDEGGYEFAIVDSDAEGWTPEAIESRKKDLRRRSSGSSVDSNATRASTGTRKKDSGDKLATLPSEAVPFGLMADLSLKKNRHRGSSVEAEEHGGDKANVGVANDEFFTRPGSIARSTQASQGIEAPHILTRGIITPLEAEKLFSIFFERMNLSLSLVDPVLYTAQRTCLRSPFMFTVICAISSRYYTERPDLYPQAMHFAQLAAGTALIGGPKNIEMCIGYILLSLYPVPSRRWEDQRGWLYLGLAIRIATDLNLHLPNTAKPLNENHAREMLNRTRVWLNCFNLDRSTGSQYGKAPIISNMDYTANHSENWWKSSVYNLKNFDIHLSCYNADLRVMGRFLARIYNDPNHPTGLNKEVDIALVATETDEELKELKEKWMALLNQTDLSDPQNYFRIGLLKLAFSYARLVALSFGFQHVFSKKYDVENPFLIRCLTAACDVVDVMVNELGRTEQRIYLRHGPEAQKVFTTFAAAFLVKLLQPKFAPYLSADQCELIRGRVQNVIDLFGSPEVAIDDRHGPKLYSRFLKGLLAMVVDNRGKIRRPKSSSSMPTADNASRSSSVFPASPATTTHSLSPPPSQAAMSFEQFAPPGGVADPFAPTGLPVEQMDTMQGLLAPDAEYFTPPLPFDNDILQSMQSLTDPSVWQDIALPGFDWMSNFRDTNFSSVHTHLH